MPSQLPERSPSREMVASPPRVLIVDDEISIRFALRRYFARRGWTACEAEDGISALRLLEPNVRGAFDVVICDLRMPRLSGFDLYRWLARNRPDVASRTIFSTGDPEALDTLRFLCETGRPVLAKPFELAELARLVEEIRGAAQSA